jgi:hypothetical protein
MQKRVTKEKVNEGWSHERATAAGKQAVDRWSKGNAVGGEARRLDRNQNVGTVSYICNNTSPNGVGSLVRDVSQGTDKRSGVRFLYHQLSKRMFTELIGEHGKNVYFKWNEKKARECKLPNDPYLIKEKNVKSDDGEEYTIVATLKINEVEEGEPVKKKTKGSKDGKENE